MEKKQIDAEDIKSCMFIKKNKTLDTDEQLALFMQRFNLDWDTVETMPAFDEHRKALFSRHPKK
jgi:hypothetical protein